VPADGSLRAHRSQPEIVDEGEQVAEIALTSGLEVESCSKRYGPVAALQSVSFRVRPGTVVGLVGANGAGKTTMLHALVGLVRLDSGSMSLDGRPMSSLPAKRMTAFMPDDLPRPVRLTGREMIELNCRLYDRRSDRIDLLTEQLELGGRLDQPLAGYSHGMRRKVDLIAALAVEPRLLVMDEPFSGLDPGMVDALQSMLLDLRSDGTAILVSSHDLELVEAIADELVVLDVGRVAFTGPSEALMSQRSAKGLREAFLNMTID